jgi:ferredoxin--NADP+ reductase
MFRVVYSQRLHPQAVLLKLAAPEIARRRRAGQFVVVRPDEKGERIPLTIVDSDPEEGTITLAVQEVGTTTRKLGRLKKGDFVRDVIGPLGHPTAAVQVGEAVCLAGGIGAAEALPVVKALRAAGNRVTAIVGARTQDLLILEDELRRAADRLTITTDDGSYGKHGRVTDALLEMINDGRLPDLVYAIGPVPMMRAVADLTRPYAIKTIVSLNPLMVDGTGMCGCCRVTVGGKTRFACVDGPEFDGHEVDFDELARRQNAYLEDEKRSLETWMTCSGKGTEGSNASSEPGSRGL